MDLYNIIITILKSTSETLKLKDDVESSIKNIICKNSILFLENKRNIIELSKKYLNITNNDLNKNEFFVEKNFIESLKNVLQKNIDKNKKSINKIETLLNNMIFEDNTRELRKTLKKERTLKKQIDKKALIQAILNLNNEQLRKLMLTNSEIKLLKNILLMYEDIDSNKDLSWDEYKEMDEVFNAFSDTSNYFKSDYLNIDDMNSLDLIFQKLYLADYDTLQELDLDVILYESPFTLSEKINFTSDTVNNISRFIINNINITLLDFNTINNLNNFINFNFISNDIKMKPYLENFYIDSLKSNKLCDKDKLLIIINIFNILTNVYNKYGINYVKKINDINNEIELLYSDVILKETLNDIMLEENNDYDELLNNNKNIFNLIYGFDVIKKEVGMQDENSLYKIIDKNGIMKGLTNSEIAAILIELNVVDNKKNVSNEYLQNLKESIIQKRNEENIIDIISNFRKNTISLKGKSV